MTTQIFRLRWDGNHYYLPAALRKNIYSTWVLTKGAKGLDLYSKVLWSSWLAKIREMEESDKKTDLIRYKIAPSYEVDLQKKDLYIPLPLMHWAGLGQGEALFSLKDNLGHIFSVK